MDNIVFVVGQEVNYDKALSSEPEVKKVGRNDLDYPDYDGGGVFRTVDSARKYIEDNNLPYAVYKIQLPTDWATDVDDSKELEEGFCRLLNNSIIIGKVDHGK